MVVSGGKQRNGIKPDGSMFAEKGPRLGRGNDQAIVLGRCHAAGRQRHFVFFPFAGDFRDGRAAENGLAIGAFQRNDQRAVEMSAFGIKGSVISGVGPDRNSPEAAIGNSHRRIFRRLADVQLQAHVQRAIERLIRVERNRSVADDVPENRVLRVCLESPVADQVRRKGRLRRNN